MRMRWAVINNNINITLCTSHSLVESICPCTHEVHRIDVIHALLFDRYCTGKEQTPLKHLGFAYTMKRRSISHPHRNPQAKLISARLLYRGFLSAKCESLLGQNPCNIYVYRLFVHIMIEDNLQFIVCEKSRKRFCM